MKNLSRPAFLQRFALLLVLLATATFTAPFALAQASKTDKKNIDSKAIDGNTILAKVGPENITYKTLEEAFRKNLNNKNVVLSALPSDSVRDFLNLYINYRLKVLDAKTRGIDQKPDIIEDIKQNRASLAVPYLFEKVLIAKRVDTAMARRKVQFKVGLILSKITGADTMPAFKRSVAMLAALKKGADFTKMAKDSSDDEYFRAQGGEMPMVTSDRIIREIENAVFTMKVGEIYSKPIRSNLSVPGYYIVKLLAMEPRVAVRGRYIVVKLEEQAKDSADAAANAIAASKKLADSLYPLIKKGEDFATLAKKFSTDAYAENGGLFPNYYTQTTGYVNGLRYRFPDVVDAWLFDPKRKDGDLSEPIQTFAGTFIVRRDSSQIGGDEREDMKRFYKRVHFEADKKVFFDSVKKARKYVLSQKTFDAFIKAVDTTRPAFDSAQKLKLPAKLQKETLASFTDGKSGYKLTVNGFADSLLLRPDVRGFSLTKQGVMQALDKVVEAAITDALTRDMEKDFPDFAALMKEFQEGILIFRVEEQEVWSRMKFDTVKARAWHEGQKEKFKTTEMYDFSEIWVKSDSLAQVLYKRLQTSQQATKPSATPTATLFDSLAMQFTERTGYKERKGRWEPFDGREFTIPGELRKRGSKAGDILAPFKFQSGLSIVRMNALLTSRVKSFDEAIPDFAAQFQDLQQRELTQKWLDSLRAKHTVVIEQETIKSIWK
jgi:peptidyl-prolyl cis-trans isomerase SurA